MATRDFSNLVPFAEEQGQAEATSEDVLSRLVSFEEEEKDDWIPMRERLARADAEERGEVFEADDFAARERERLTPEGLPTFQGFTQKPLRGGEGRGGAEDSDGGFVRGQDKPDVTSPLDQAKYVGESVLKGAAGIVDFVDLLVGDGELGELSDKLMWNHSNKVRVEQGKEPLPYKPQESFTKMTEEGIKDFYRYTGQEPELYKAETGLGKAGQLVIENLVGGGIIGGIFKGVKTLSSATKGKSFMDWYGKKVTNFTPMPAATKTAATAAAESAATKAAIKADVTMSTTGALAGGVGFEIGTTDQQKESYANLFNLAGGFAPVLKNMVGWGPTGLAYKSLMKISRDMPGSDKLWDLHDKHVMANLAKLVPEDQLVTLKNKVRSIRAIQTVIPDFKPSVGATIGTSHSRQVQAYIDSNSKNFASASKQYRINKDAVERVAKEITEETDPAKREIVATALRVLRTETIHQADRLQKEMKTVQAGIADLARAGQSDSARGEELREAYKLARGLYKEHFSNIWKGVDPEGTAKFDVSDIEGLVTVNRASRSLRTRVTGEDEGFGFLNTVLPDFLKDLKGKAEGKAFTLAGAAPKPASMTFDEIHNLRSMIGEEAAGLRSSNPDSKVASILDNIRFAIDDTIESRMTAGDPQVSSRYVSAKDSYRDIYSANFQNETVGQKIIQTAGGEKIPVDQIAGRIWNTGANDADAALKQFDDIFNGNILNIKDPEALQVARSVAMENLEDFAIRDLQRALETGKGDPDAIVGAWVKKNQANINAFPSIRSSVDDIGQAVSERSLLIEDLGLRVDDLTDNVLKRYKDIDTDTLIPELMTSSPNAIKRTLRDLLHRNGLVEDFDPELVDPRTIRSLVNTEAAEDAADLARRVEANAILDAISEATVQNLIRRSMKTDGSGFDPKILRSDLAQVDSPVSEDALKFLLNPKGLSEIETLRKASFLLGQEVTNPAIKIELDDIVAIFNQYNMSIPSISARIYAVQLGKVGPAFIIADNAQRIFRGISSKRTNDVYARTMYNIDALEEMIDLRIKAGGGDKEAMEELAKYTGELKNIFTDIKQFAKDPTKFLREMIKGLSKIRPMHGVRLDQFFDDLEEYDDEEQDMTDFMIRTLNHKSQRNTLQSNEQIANSEVDTEEESVTSRMKAMMASSVVEVAAEEVPEDFVSPGVDEVIEAEEPAPTEVPTEEETLEDTKTFSIEEVNAKPLKGKAIFKKGTFFGGQNAINEIEKREGALSEEQARVVELEGFVNKPYLDTRGNVTIGVGQTGKFMTKTFKESFEEHADRARIRFPDYDKLPSYLRAELVQAEYRGDLGFSRKTVKLFNEGKFEEASIEFLNNENFKDEKTPESIKARIMSVSDAIAKYGIELEDSEMPSKTSSDKPRQSLQKGVKAPDRRSEAPTRTPTTATEGVGTEAVPSTTPGIAPVEKLSVADLPEKKGNPLIAGQTAVPTLNDKIRSSVNPFI